MEADVFGAVGQGVDEFGIALRAREVGVVGDVDLRGCVSISNGSWSLRWFIWGTTHVPADFGILCYDSLEGWDRGVDVVALVVARFDQKSLEVGFRESAGERAASCAGSDDDEIVFVVDGGACCCLCECQ